MSFVFSLTGQPKFPGRTPDRTPQEQSTKPRYSHQAVVTFLFDGPDLLRRLNRLEKAASLTIRQTLQNARISGR